MNIFKKKIKGDLEDDWKPTGSFVRKPVKGWIHPDHQLESSGVVYQTRVGFKIIYAYSFCNALVKLLLISYGILVLFLLEFSH